MLAYGICFSLSDLLHSVRQSLGPSTSLQISQFHSFLWLSNIPLYICATSSLSIHLLMVFNGEVISPLWCRIYRIKKILFLVVRVIHDRKMIKLSSSKKNLPLNLILQIVKIILKKYYPLLHSRRVSFHFSSGFNFYRKGFLIEKTWSNKRKCTLLNFLEWV